MRTLQETPETMVRDGRVSAYGAFREPFREVNLMDLDLQIGGRKTGRTLKDMRLKEWEHFGFIHDEVYFGCVIFDAKYLATSFFYVFDRKSGEFFEHTRTGPKGSTRVARELWHAECFYRSFGYTLEFENRLDAGMHRIKASIKGSRRKPPVTADLRVLEDIDRYQPLVIVSPVSENRPLYTHKSACPVEGTVEFGGRKVELAPDRCVALMDVQKTFYPYNTFWKWATFGGYDAGGRLIAMNACRNFITNDEEYNENCCWVDGKIGLTSAARFTYDENDLLADWKLDTTDGKVDLTFSPKGKRVGRMNFGILLSDFNQPFGEFSGRITGPDGEEVPAENYFGLCEHHIARF